MKMWKQTGQTQISAEQPQSLEWIGDSAEGQQVSWLGTRLHLDQSLALPLATLPWEAASWVYCECLCA